MAHMEQVLATAWEQNARLIAELAHTRTMVLQGQHDAERVATLAKLTEKDARRQQQLEGLQKHRHLHTIREQRLLAAPTGTGGLAVSPGDLPEIPQGMTTSAAVTRPPQGQSTSYQGQPLGRASPTSGDRESTPRRRSPDAHRPRSSRSPLGNVLLFVASVTREVRLC